MFSLSDLNASLFQFLHFIFVSSVAGLSILVIQGNILIDSRLNLLLHLCLHFSLCASSIAVEDWGDATHDKDSQSEDLQEPVLMILELHNHEVFLVDIVRFEELLAVCWDSVETCTNGVEYSFNLKLSSEGLVVDDHRRVELRSISVVIQHLGVYHSVDEALIPQLDWITAIFNVHFLAIKLEGLINAVLSVFPWNSHYSVGISCAVLIHVAIAQFVDCPYILPPLVAVRSKVIVRTLVDTKLSEVFKNDLSTGEILML